MCRGTRLVAFACRAIRYSPAGGRRGDVVIACRQHGCDDARADESKRDVLETKHVGEEVEGRTASPSLPGCTRSRADYVIKRPVVSRGARFRHTKSHRLESPPVTRGDGWSLGRGCDGTCP